MATKMTGVQGVAETESVAPDPNSLPRHVAIIMDGNGRWAQRQGLPRIEGHRRGVGSVRAVVEQSSRLGLGQLTLYCLSSENWKRPKLELDFLMRPLEQYVIEERSEIMDQKIRFRTIGRREGLSPGVLTEIDKTIELSRSNSGMVLCLAVNYGGRLELVDAVRQIARQVSDGKLGPESIDEQTISASLYTAGMVEPDLLIRTAGEMRLSNFLLWQCSYSELYVTPTCWPDFRSEELIAAFRAYAQRRRKYGGLEESRIEAVGEEGGSS